MGFDLIKNKEKIKYGIKIAIKNFDLLSKIYDNKDIIDFIEVIVPPEFTINDIELIKNLKINYAIHLPTSKYNFDLGNKSSNKKNLEIINRINQYESELSELNPLCYIIHPESDDINLSISNLKKIKISPLALENMTVKGIHGEKMIGYDINSLKPFFEQIPNLEFCFDLNHAIKAAITMKIDYLKFIILFLKFKKPKIFHISDGNLNVEIDEHLNLNEGEYNFSEIKRILIDYNSNVYLTFETPKNYDFGIRDDLRNIKFFSDI